MSLSGWGLDWPSKDVSQNKETMPASHCSGGCGCGKNARQGGCEEKIIWPDIDKLVLEVARGEAKLCPRCEAAYLAVVPAPVQPAHDIPTHCTECGALMIWAHLPLCWCGASIHPRDRYCGTEGHLVCRFECRPCPGWHDYSREFAD